MSFRYRGGALHCEDVAVDALVDEVGAPVYVYSRAALLDRFAAVRDAFADVETTVCFSVKCCSNTRILALLARAGSGFDIVSGGELFRVLKAGGDPAKAVFAGVAKSEAEIAYALRERIRLFNVESEAELARIDRIAGAMGTTAPVALRLNPDIDAKTHAKTTTGKKENKFGIDLATAATILAEAGSYRHLRFAGVDMHLGSPINTLEPYARGLEKTVAFLREHINDHTPIETVDVGGGFGLLYRDEDVPSFADYAAAIVPPVAALGAKLIVEPGRSIAGNAAVLVGEVQYVKEHPPKTFVLLDAGMNDLIRPAMYDAYHFLWPTRTRHSPQGCRFAETLAGTRETLGELVPTDVCGPICESSDVFAKDRPLPPVAQGQRLAIFSTGAYGFAMSSQYNSHPRPPEVLVDGDTWEVIGRRETYEDLVALET